MADQVYRFGRFALDLNRGALTGNAGPLYLRPKAQSLLTYLARNMGRVVPKSELMDAVWPGIYVTEDSLTQSIREVRKALGDESQNLVRTIARRGYMLAPDTEQMEKPGTQPTVAVLRFRNDTGDEANKPIVDGIAEEIINGIARFGTVTVLARHSSFSVPAAGPDDLAQVRSRIGAGYLVEGSVRRSGQLLHVTVNLIDAENLARLWGDRYEAQGSAIFDVEQDIVERVIGRLVASLEDASASRALRKSTTDLAAYELMLKGLALLRGNNLSDFKVGSALLEKAIEKDPAYGLAHAHLAYAKVMIGGFGHASPAVLAEALAIAARAIVLSPDSATGYRVLSFVQMYQREYEAAEHNLRRSLELNRYASNSVEQLGYLLTLRGRPVEAMSWFDRAVRLNPLHPPWYETDRAFAHYSLGDYRAAAAAIEHAPVLRASMRTWLAACYAQMGDIEKARFQISKIAELDPDFSAYSYARSNGPAFERPGDHQHFAEGVYLALGLPPGTGQKTSDASGMDAGG